jgi:hypothetical protein
MKQAIGFGVLVGMVLNVSYTKAKETAPESVKPVPVVSEENQTAASPAAPAPDHAGEMPGNQKITWEMRRQVPFVRDGGLLNRKETAVLMYVDGDLFPPAVMVAIQRGLFYWMTVGLDVGGDMGVFQAMLRIKQEMGRTRRTNFFFWGWHIRTGYKYVNVDMRDTLGQDTAIRFDDNSWVLAFQNTFSLRFGNHRRRAMYLTSQVYGDFDLRGKGIQPDLYIYPATLGFETVLGQNWNFFFEAGVILSINGWELSDGTIMSKNGDLFPTASMGFAYRFGGVSTALPLNWRDPEAPPMK